MIAYAEPRRPGFTRMAFVNSQGQPLYTNLGTDPLPNGPNLSTGGVAWAPDGRRLAVVSNRNSIWIIEPEAAQLFRRLTTLPPKQRFRGLTWTRDSAAVIVGVEHQIGDIVLFERPVTAGSAP